MSEATSPIGESTLAIEYALRALDHRNEIIADNVANAEVPGFRASELSFEAALKDAIGAGDLTRIKSPVISGTDDPPGALGNNVQIEEEVMELMKTNLLRSFMVDAFNFKLEVMRTAVRGQ